MQKLECKFKFAKIDIFLKIKPDSASICEYEKPKLWHSCEIYMTVHDGNHEIDFVIELQRKKNKDKI